MRTLTLPAGARVAVVAARWHDAFAVVTRGHVQLELRDGAPGPVLTRGAGFWLRGTGVRALRNPGSRTAILRIAVPGTSTTPSRRYDMSSIHAGQALARPASARGLAGIGATAVVAAVVSTTLAAAVAGAIGADFEIPDGGEAIPLSGFAVVTGVCAAVGVLIAMVLRRWSARPAVWFVRTTVPLTAVSLIPPFLVGAAPATVAALVVLHLVPAAVMIPVLARALRGRSATGVSRSGVPSRHA